MLFTFHAPGAPTVANEVAVENELTRRTDTMPRKSQTANMPTGSETKRSITINNNAKRHISHTSSTLHTLHVVVMSVGGHPSSTLGVEIAEAPTPSIIYD
jgi:hypothetical protein